MIRIAVVDDDKNALYISSTLLKETFEKRQVEYELSSFTSPSAFLATAKEKPFDLIVLDIDMPEENGIDLAKDFRKKQFETTIIFLSQMENLVFDCFEARPFGFIRKDKLFEDFERVMSLYFDKIASKGNDSNKLLFRVNSALISINLDSIIYIEAKKNYQSAYLKDGAEAEIRSSMNELEEKLRSHKFIRIHKGFIVNIEYIRRFEGRNVIMTNGASLPISREKKNDVVAEYLSLTSKNNAVFLN